MSIIMFSNVQCDRVSVSRPAKISFVTSKEKRSHLVWNCSDHKCYDGLQSLAYLHRLTEVFSFFLFSKKGPDVIFFPFQQIDFIVPHRSFNILVMPSQDIFLSLFPLYLGYVFLCSSANSNNYSEAFAANSIASY